MFKLVEINPQNTTDLLNNFKKLSECVKKKAEDLISVIKNVKIEEKTTK